MPLLDSATYHEYKPVNLWLWDSIAIAMPESQMQILRIQTFARPTLEAIGSPNYLELKVSDIMRRVLHDLSL